MSRLVLVALHAACSASGCLKRTTSRPTEDEQQQAITEHNAKAEPGEKLVCRRERVTGSHMRQNVCRYQKDKSAERERAQQEMRRRNLPTPGGPEAGGGY